jgi:hypothetical protein
MPDNGLVEGIVLRAGLSSGENLRSMIGKKQVRRIYLIVCKFYVASMVSMRTFIT